MKTLPSYVQGEWFSANDSFASLVDPCSEEPLAQLSSAGVDFGAVLEYARQRGRAALGELTPAQRGAVLLEMSRALHAKREELIELSVANSGATRKDAKFDIDGATFSLAHYGHLGEELGDRRILTDGDGIQLGRSSRFWGEHALLPLHGVAVHINAFNFPAWGWAEKAACALLAGMPVVTKPASSTALVAHRCIEILVEAAVVPEGALSLICGNTGDLLDRLGAQDVLAFTGSADTALKLRSKTNLLASSTRVNIEADSLNAAVLGPDVAPGSESWELFLRDVVRELTQKSGQKCTAVRRILVPQDRLDDLRDALCERLEGYVTGNPRDASVNMGPLATASQLDDAVRGVAQLRESAKLVFGEGTRVEGAGNPAGKGYFFAPTLLQVVNATDDGPVHRHEVFGPVGTLLPYDGSATQAATSVGLAQGTLVCSVYSDDAAFLSDYLVHGGATTGRLYFGSEKVAAQLPGSGVVMPHLVHGGPGRAGGGEELGGLRGLSLYLQRVAVSGDRAMIERMTGKR